MDRISDAETSLRREQNVCVVCNGGVSLQHAFSIDRCRNLKSRRRVEVVEGENQDHDKENDETYEQSDANLLPPVEVQPDSMAVGGSLALTIPRSGGVPQASVFGNPMSENVKAHPCTSEDKKCLDSEGTHPMLTLIFFARSTILEAGMISP